MPSATATSSLIEQDPTPLRVPIPAKRIEAFCRRHHIRKLAFFGSVLREDFDARSDIDVLVEFDPDHVPGLIRLSGMELELSELLGGRKVDLNTAKTLSPYFRDEVLREARLQYVAA